MATTVNRYVDLASATGGDGTTSATSGANRAYASLDDAIVAEVATRPNLVTNDEILHIHLAGTTADTDTQGSYSTINFGNYSATFTTDATRYLILEVDAANQHPGFFSTSHYRLSRGSLTAIVTDPPNFTIFRGIQFVSDNDAELVGHLVPAVGQTMFFERCLFHATHATPTQVYAITMSGNANRKICYVSNCVFSGSGLFDAIRLRFPDNGKLVAYNNTIIGAKNKGINIGDADSTFNAHVKNNIIEHAGSGVCYDLGSATVTSATNISSDTTSPQVGLRSITLTLDDRGTFFYALDAADSSAINGGTDLSADGQLAFSTDILNATRSSTWEIGAFNFTSGGVTSKPNYYRSLYHIG